MFKTLGTPFMLKLPRSWMKRWKPWLPLAVLFILAGGVRFAGLAKQFSHYDDARVATAINSVKQRIATGPQGIYDTSNPEFDSFDYRLERKLSQLGIWKVGMWATLVQCVPRKLTYAPLQFLLTIFLVHPDQTYREILFWGRLPSLLFGMMGLLALFYLYGMLEDRESLFHQLLAGALFAFSWTNIIYAKHMSSYAIGPTAILSLLILLLIYFRETKITRKQIFVLSVTIALIASTNYQVLFLLPAFFATLILFHLRKKERDLSNLRALAITSIATAVMLLPLVKIYLFRFLGNGVGWNVGPKAEFFFRIPANTGPLEKLSYTVNFFVSNSLLSLKAISAFVPEQSALFNVTGVVLVALGLLGGVSLLRSRERNRRYLGIFFALTCMTWFLLIVFRKITLSPTRHSLILLPFLIISIVEGVRWLAEKIPGRATPALRFAALSVGATAFVIINFFRWYPDVIRERTDPFDPPSIADELRRYGVKDVLDYCYAENVELMVKDFPVKIHSNPYVCKIDKAAVLEKIAEPSTFALLGTQGKVSEEMEEQFELLLKREVSSDVEVDLLPRTKNGSNNLRFYIFRAKRGRQTQS